jgi:hypothetical protein
MLSAGVSRVIRRIARAVLPAPRPRFNREALTLAIRYSVAAEDAQRLVDALGAEQAEVSLLIARAFNVDVRSVVERVRV